MSRKVFIAHLPAAYLASRAFPAEGPASLRRAMTVACLVGSVLPDVDLVWWWLVDHKRVHHHDYWTHLPLFWAIAALCVLAFERHRVVLAFFVGVASHLVLDTFVGDIKWLLPFSDRYVHFVEVPARHDGGHWAWSFVLHWTFLVELLITAAAVAWFARLRILRALARRRSRA